MDKHPPMEVRHRDEPEWEATRRPGETRKMLFHPIYDERFNLEERRPVASERIDR